jgi:L-arabinose isomerase
VRKPKVGLLPLYLELYDNAMPEVRPEIDKYQNAIVSGLLSRKIDVLTVPARRLAEEFEGAVRFFEDAKVDAIVTLHLAYSPSLECIDALSSTALPIIVLDTTRDFSYGPQTDPGDVMFNHGIHGVQDMCNMLIRRGKPFWIEAGHFEKSDVLDRVASWARAALIATNMRNARVGRIGEAFQGMGDFAVETEVLEGTIGVKTVVCEMSRLSAAVPAEDDPAVEEEMTADREKFQVGSMSRDAHARTTRAGLAVRKWIEKEKLTAFTMNFLAFDAACGVPTVPFLEASKAMARRIGYAGEGDVLTASLVGALASVYPGTTFTEIFCPDWESNRIFISHMGEMNLTLAAEKPVLVETPFPWTDTQDPVVAFGRFRGGKAVLVNLAPGPEDTFSLLVAPVTMADIEGEDKMKESIHGWFEPPLPVAEFLEEYSRAGGTHHSALVYGDLADEIARFGQLMGWETIEFVGEET